MDEAKGVSQFVVVVDFTGLGYGNFDLEGTKVMVEVLEAYFPERLGTAMCINTGWLFWILWKLISPFIPKRTRDKVLFFALCVCVMRVCRFTHLPKTQVQMLRDEGHYRPILRRMIHPDNIPVQFGGTAANFDPHFVVWFLCTYACTHECVCV